MTTQPDAKRAGDAGDTGKPDSDDTSAAADADRSEDTDSASVDALYEQAVRRMAALDADWAQVMDGFRRPRPHS